MYLYVNTPTHIILNSAILSKRATSQYNSYIFWGSLLPDSVIFTLFIWEGLIKQTAQSAIWDTIYLTSTWQIPNGYANSIPIVLAFVLLARWKNITWLYYLSASSLLHLLLDFPLHNDDAHPHFLPLTNWRFNSPVSYWDPEHYGGIVSGVELMVFIIAFWFAYSKFTNQWTRRISLFLGVLWVLASVSIWLFFLF